jgi:RNA polymerase sigma-70 factor (ECF subfamily)
MKRIRNLPLTFRCIGPLNGRRGMSTQRPDTSDEGLLRGYRAGREEAFTLLFRRYSRRLFGYVLGIVRDPDLADDVIQKVFVKLARRPEVFKPRASFSSWIHQVARNAALDALKSSRRRRDDRNRTIGEGTGEEAEPVAPGNPGEGFRNEAIRSLVNQAIERLEGPKREALVLREYSELSYTEIAEITGRPLTTIKQDIYQARQILRAQLAPHLERIGSE